MEEKSIVIIGAGIAGLSAVCYGQMNGYRTQIFELQNKPGGLCTSWERKGYTIDGCLHWLVGSAPGSKFYQLWEELGAIQERRMIYQEELMRIEGADSKTFILYTNIDRLEQHMMELAPAGSRLAKDLQFVLNKLQEHCKRYSCEYRRPRNVLLYFYGNKSKEISKVAAGDLHFEVVNINYSQYISGNFITLDC